MHGVRSTVSQGMYDFQDATHHCSLLDLAAHGPRFTWTNKREEGLISKKLDRVLINDHWLGSYPQSYSVFEAGGCSDHLRCRFQLSSALTRPKRPFKFVNAVAELEGFKPLMEDHWQSTEPIFLSTSSLFRFSKKLKALKPKIRILAKEKMGNLSLKAKEAYENLCTCQEETIRNPTQGNLDRENSAYAQWDHVARLEEGFLKQKFKLHWLKVGDKNNKVFHRAATTRDIHNSIKEIRCRDGRIVKQPEEIKEEFFQRISSARTIRFRGCRCEQTSRLTAIQMFKVCSTQSYKRGPEFIISIQSFFATCFLPKGLNTTILTLIPKTTTAREMKDYRPISCCNVIYKVISKIIANRLKITLPDFIELNQSAFVQGRLLIENLLLATELVKDYHKDTISSRCALKIDISKAFDSVQWSFLLKTLEAMDFPPMFIHWISRCITTASFSVQVNGELAGYFQSTRGLRQGCALSPYLFVICMNVLTKLLDKSANENNMGYHPRCKNLGLTHLSFADDIMVFTDGRVRSIESILDVFDYFGKISGLKISMEKTTIYYAGMSVTETAQLEQRFAFASGKLPVRYLGLPLLTRRMGKDDYGILIDKIRNRITHWTNRFLSQAGRLQLIGSVLLSIVNFWMAGFILPGACIKEINSICAAFLWSGPTLNTRKAKVAWEIVCRRKCDGGLGLRSLKEVNQVCCLKLIWRTVSSQGSLWTKWTKTNLFKNVSFWSIKNTTTKGSWMWRKLVKLRDKAKDFHRMKVGDGNNTSFWFDSWSSMGRLLDLFGTHGCIEMGIPLNSTVAEALRNRRKRRHRVDIFNEVEKLCEDQGLQLTGDADSALWKQSEGQYKAGFKTKQTWDLIRKEYQQLLSRGLVETGTGVASGLFY
ncbi:uncharacterized protein LOC130507391 [Raphanus sativus]|uniref:Uncharacterized protein LOC130507391 n=1 Tax=Raphanus sativus TaxID=3726 RepID=A0A9W3D2W9_RAPSA|nr:uncharacterized protein LOC130507391 [Raphanus sativus]